MPEVVVGELVSEHEGQLLVEELVLALDLPAVDGLRRIEEPRRGPHDGRIGALVLRDEADVLVDFALPEELVDGLGLREVRLNLEQAIADRHRGAAAARAGGESVDFSDLVIDEERDPLNAGLLSRGEVPYELGQDALSLGAEEAQVHEVDRIVHGGGQDPGGARLRP